MEIIRKFKENGYFTSDLYHLLANKKMVHTSEEIIPSVYEKEMKMSCADRLKTLTSMEVENHITTGGQKADKPVLSFTPRIIIFQNFQPNEKIVAKFSLMNISQAPIFLNMVFKESSQFSIKTVGAEFVSRLAPGIKIVFAVTFFPQKFEDYTHRMNFFTDIDQYVLPIIAMGPRPILNFPDEIVVPDTPLKVENSIHVAITNIGMVPASFTLNTKCPFSTHPKSASLNPNAKQDFDVKVKTMYLGGTTGVIRAIIETGEIFRIEVKGKTYIVSVELEKAAVRFLDTYNTMARQQTYKITNKSNQLITYSCMKNESVYHDFEDKMKLATKLYDVKESESLKYAKLVRYDVLTSDEHDRVYTRIFFDEIQELVVDESLLFQNMHFSVTPIKGNLWPNKTTELTVTFNPKEIGDFQSFLYLDIDGIKERVPLKLLGTSLPPSIQLNCETLDMDSIYINKIYYYEIVAFNKGLINGMIVYNETPTVFGSTISCTPKMICLKPGEKEIFTISFCNPNHGPYFEEIHFIIRDTKVVLKLYLKGKVVYPSVMFSETSLEFGNVSVGVPKSVTIEVINDSVVDVKGSVKIPSDGPEISAFTLEDCDACCENTNLPSIPWAKEFKIEPNHLEIESEDRVPLTVTLTANMARAYQTQMEFELQKSDSPSIVLPVTFNAMVPEVTSAPDINIKDCFVGYVYHQEVVLQTRHYRGYFTIVEPEVKEGLEINVLLKRGIIETDSTVTIPVTIKAMELGYQEHYLRMSLFGQSKSFEVCHIYVCGIKPIVTCTPMSLHWGQLKLLNPSSKSLTLINESPLPVIFKTSMLNKDPKWVIAPSEGEMQPESEIELVITICLSDAATYYNKAVIQLEKIKDIFVPLSAVGIGTSITVGKQRDKISLGIYFTKSQIREKVKVKNCGTRYHSLEWNLSCKTKAKQQNVVVIQPFFNLEPREFKLFAGEEIEMTVTGLSNKVCELHEMWYLIGSVEGCNKKELLIECLITAEFIDPIIELGTTQINLQYDYGPYSEFYRLTEILTLRNCSRLPLHLEINIRPPFAIIEKQGSYKIPPEEMELCHCITYNENDLKVENMTKMVGYQRSREYIDCLTLKPVEPSRKDPLMFFQDIHKIKMAFNLTHSVEEMLGEQEVMKLQILMDTTKHTTLRSRIYYDVMKIKFKGQRNKDSIKIVGKINFPNLFLETQRVDFHCILNDSVASKTFRIQNPTPLLDCYKFQWKKCHISTLPMPEISKLDFGIQSKTIQSHSSQTDRTGTAYDQKSTQQESLPSPVDVVDVQHIVEKDNTEKENASTVLEPDTKSSMNLTKDVEEVDFETLKMKILQKITPMLPQEKYTDFPWAHKFMKREKYKRYDINELFQIVPHRGLLRSNGIQNVHVIFRPIRNVNVQAVLECEVLGGPPESLIVTGRSYDLLFTLNTQKLNFKIRPFHEPAIEKLILANISYLTFEFKTYLNEPTLENELYSTIHNVDPPEKRLEPEQEIEINVIVKTGVVGYFNKSFILEIGHLPHIPIEVFGWGVISQVYFSLARPDIHQLHPEIGYKAIATLTVEYLGVVGEMFSSISMRTEHLNTPQLEKCFEDPELQFEWHICSAGDTYPSTMDIELAMERYLVINHISQRPEILTLYSSNSRTGPIPNFYTTPYVIDFGVVVTDSTTTWVPDIINYGPVPTKLNFMKNNPVNESLSMKLCGKLMPGETGKLEVTFAPKSDTFTELEQTMETQVNIEVPYGVIVPLKIKAQVAVPYLKTNVTKLDFGTVRCGDKIVCSIPFENVGKPICIWYVTLKLKTPGPSPMTILENSGKYEAGEDGWITISFKPEMEMLYEGMLVFKYYMNPTKMLIPVVGNGILPHVHVIGPNINFPATLPWSDTTEIYFGLTNPCPFAIELIMAHSDEKWAEEEEVFHFLHKYYNNPEEMLVPAIKPGAGLPPEIIQLHKMFKDQVKRSIEQESAAAAKALQQQAKQSPNLKKVAKSPKTPAGKAASNKEKGEVAVTPPPRIFRTEAEIILDEIKLLKELGHDPLKECIQRLEPPEPEDESFKLKGLIILVHGAPSTEMFCQEMAYTMGMKLSLPTVNFDLCIVEALCVCTCPAQSFLLNGINELYEIAKKILSPRYSTEEEAESEMYNEDEIDAIRRKIEYLSVNMQALRADKKSDKKKPASSPIDAKQPALSILAPMGSPYLFQMEYIQELLTDYFCFEKFETGFIIDSLTSIIVKLPTLVLTAVLRCRPMIQNVRLVLCHEDFNAWVKRYEEALEIESAENVPKLYTEEEVAELIQKFEEMDADEYDNADPNEKELYIIFGLDARRQKRYNKLDKSAGRKEKKDKTMMTDGSTYALLDAQSDSKKKGQARKDDSRSRHNAEITAMSTRYNDYVKSTLDQLINIANNWVFEDGDVGYPLYTINGQLVGAVAQKKTKKKSEVHLQVLTDSEPKERGFPLTVIMCPCLQYKIALVNMMKNDPAIQMALNKKRKVNILSLPVKRKEYTVLLPKTMPVLQYVEPLKWLFLEEKPISKCECNLITDLNLLDDSTQDNVLNILSKWHCTCGKKLASSQTSTTDIPSADMEKMQYDQNEAMELPLNSVKAAPDRKGRIVLQPGDLLRCKYVFNPTLEGHFTLKRFVEVYGWPESKVDIIVNGISDLPRLDSRPKKMFKHFVRRTVEDHVYKRTFLDELKLFEFGPIFVGPNRVYEEEDTIILRNCSLMLAEIDIEFEDDTSIFKLDKAFVKLEPGGRDKLVVNAAPAVVGVHTNQLLFCIKDNPEIVQVTIACSGVVPKVEILPLSKFIDYGRLLLYRREDDRFIVKNDSILPVMWRVRNVQDFMEHFIISETSGIVQRNENQVVPITYTASQVTVITKKMLMIDIFDELGRGEPMMIDALFLSAECYDVMMECAYEDSRESCLNFGNVKVNSTEYKEMFLLNRGKYPVYFKLKKVKNFPEPALLKSFEAVPECGEVPPTLRLEVIEFSCTPVKNVNLVNVPAYNCSLLDGSKAQVVIAKFPVCVTIASFYNTFTLFPLGELNFDIISVGSGVMKEVILSNTSKCPFIYEIVVPEKYKVIAPPTVSPTKGGKIKVPPVKCGNFLIISHEDNLIAPGTKRSIQIQFFATAPRRFEETIKFLVSDTCPAEAMGVPFTLVGTGAMPSLDFWNLETTFREHTTVETLAEHKNPQSIPHCVFTIDTVTMHFFNVIINTTFKATLDLYNNGVVTSSLTAKLTYQSNTDDKIFSVDKEEMSVQPLLHKKFNIIFSPKELEEYRAVLNLKLKLLDNEESSYKVCLIGTGTIPRISLVSPQVRQYRLAALHFPMTSLGSNSIKEVVFKNISPLKTTVTVDILQSLHEERDIFNLDAGPSCKDMVLDLNRQQTSMTVILDTNQVMTVNIHFNPLNKGRTSCDMKLTIKDNPYEYFTVLCEAEAFIEDVMLIGLEMLSMEIDMDLFKTDAPLPGIGGAVSEIGDGPAAESKKKGKSAPADKKKKEPKPTKGKKTSITITKQPVAASELKYVLDFGGCELFTMHKRSVIMVNNSEKLYKFTWLTSDIILVKPSTGYISPGEEKDLEIIFFSAQPIIMRRELLACNLVAVSNDTLTLDAKGATWDNRQVVTTFPENSEVGIREREEKMAEKHSLPESEEHLKLLNINIYYSAVTEYSKYTTTLEEETTLEHTFIYQKRLFEFEVANISNVPMKIAWNFYIDDEYPARTDKMPATDLKATSMGASIEGSIRDSVNVEACAAEMSESIAAEKEGCSVVTLFSGSEGRQSVDTWFEVDLPFKIEPAKGCLNPHETKMFKVTFNPQDAFDFKVRLRSTIDNLDPYDQNICCKISVRAIVPLVHLDLEESDYLTSGRRKPTKLRLPSQMQCLEFNTLGTGCHKKIVNIVNPTSEGYEFAVDSVPDVKGDLSPVHCNMLKGYVEAGTSQEILFTFAPVTPGVFESRWKIFIPVHALEVPLMVVGQVREPNVEFVPSIIDIGISVVGISSYGKVQLRNNEDDNVTFRFKGDSLFVDTGKQPVSVDPERGVLKPRSEMTIRITYTPYEDGPLSFKIFYTISHRKKDLTLCVNTFGYSVKPCVMYCILGYEHVLSPTAINNIHLDQTASTYERRLSFNIKNNGSAAFRYEWVYSTANVKKYLQVWFEPPRGIINPGNEVDSTLHFILKKVPVKAFPVKLNIANGPKYELFLYSEIEHPLYHFSRMEIDFGKCIMNAPNEQANKINLAFTNDDKVPLSLHITQETIPELLVDFTQEPIIDPGERVKVPIYFRPKEMKEYEFRLHFWVNTLCEEIIIVKGEGVPLLVDLYEGCEKSFYLGPVDVGKKVVREISVMNSSKVPVEAKFTFSGANQSPIDDDLGTEGSSICLDPSSNQALEPAGTSRVKQVAQYKRDKLEHMQKDLEMTLASIKVIPSKVVIQPHTRVTLKVHYKPVGIIETLTHIVMSVDVFNIVKPLVLLSGCATGYNLCFNQNSLQFGHVRRCGQKTLKVMLMNKGDYSSKFCFQPLKNTEFRIEPMSGHVAARCNVLINVIFRPLNFNPFIKVWAKCSVQNYKPLELAMYAACADEGIPQTMTMLMECPVREMATNELVITNPSDETWTIFPEITPPFATLREVTVVPGATVEIPIYFKPLSMGKHEVTATFSPMGDTALFVLLIGVAIQPNPTGVIDFTVEAKIPKTLDIEVFNVGEGPESYAVATELVKVVPEKFDGYYEVKAPESFKIWGNVVGVCHWTYVCYEPCEMICRVMFVNEDTREYQYYTINVTVTPSQIAGTKSFVCRAREQVQQDVVIPNPLKEAADFYIKCDKLQVSETINIPRLSEIKYTMTYTSLVVGQSEDFLTITNAAIGTVKYRVLVRCLPAKHKVIEHTTCLGTSIPIRLRVQNKTDVKADFQASVTHPSVLLESNYSLPPNEKGKFLVWFEPTVLGEQECTISFSSNVAGEYAFDLKGTATEPKPQGPYDIRVGQFTTIRFKNVFDEDRTFRIFVDKEGFFVKNAYEQIKAKKDIKITVYLNKEAAGAELPTGCLNIEPYDPPEPKVQWNYFLQGVDHRSRPGNSDEDA